MGMMSKENGALELTLLNAEHQWEKFETLLVEGLNAGIPPEIMTRLEGIWATTKVVAGEIVAVGKIIVARLFAFLRAHPGIAIGVALGAAVGALTAGVPLLGALLAPLAGKLSMLYGAGVGASYKEGALSYDPILGIIGLAQKFFAFLCDVFISVVDYFQEA